MTPRHSPRRARIVFSDAAARQLDALTTEHELHALDRALVALSVDPDLGDPIPGSDTAGPELRQYTDDVEQVRGLYFVTVLRTVVIWGSRSVSAVPAGMGV
ncbi:hypothetical protein [Streptomyces sp. CAU 1734]|uniref:hypothetical protein n=1 Tax=Streptomyces sp. CAU 1734 TaxID=3140360 RepID=UPI00325FFC87